MVRLPPGFRWRPPRDDDAERAAALVNEEAEAHLGTPIWSAERVLDHWRQPGVDRERDVGVVEDEDGEVCAWCAVVSGPPYVEVFALGVVGPDWHGRGLGAAVLADTERRARRFLALAPPGERVVIHAGTLADEPSVSELVARRGYCEVRRFQLMRVDFAGEPAAPERPLELPIETLDPARDVVPVFEAHREAFSDHWGQTEETLEEFRHLLVDTPRFDRELALVAWDGERCAAHLIGWLEADEDPSRGYVAVLGTRRAYRGRGLGEALLRTAFRTLYRRGQRGCDLHVDTDSLTGATRLYERVGMAAHPRFATWEKELRPGVSGDLGAG